MRALLKGQTMSTCAELVTSLTAAPAPTWPARVRCRRDYGPIKAGDVLTWSPGASCYVAPGGAGVFAYGLQRAGRLFFEWVD